DYLLKPYSENRIREVLDNLVENIKLPKKSEITQKESKKIAVNSEDRIVVISTGDILYIEANEKESDIVLPGIRYKSKLKISQLEEILSEKMFFRCHRSYMVNINRIIEVEPWFNGGFIIKVEKTEFNIPVSRNKVKELKEILNIR
ncbi:MAG: LytR/AlgR family response regulator transcription factor, partial [Fusobacteriaceae bacterium]